MLYKKVSNILDWTRSFLSFFLIKKTLLKLMCLHLLYIEKYIKTKNTEPSKFYI